MKQLLIVAMACYGLSTGAQVRQNSNFIYLYSDSVIYANSIRLRPDFANGLELRADSRRVSIDQVKFFGNEQGFFANTRKLSYPGYSEFSERIIDGRINFFRQVRYDPYVYDRDYRFRGRHQEPVDVRMFYNKGFGDLKKANYSNLQEDMADRAESMDLLERYRKSRSTSKILYASAGASVIASFISFVVNAKQNQDLQPYSGKYGVQQNFNLRHTGFGLSFGLLGLGAGLAAGGYMTGLQGSRHLENAVDAYNR